MASIDNIFHISKETIRKANQKMIEYGKIKKENPVAYRLLMEDVKKRLNLLGIYITKENIREVNKKFMEKYKN